MNIPHPQVPLRILTGKLQLKDGEIADRAHPDSMSYYVEGIDAVLPEPTDIRVAPGNRGNNDACY